ncbi:hypothetical protein [Nocardia sp. MW-W600-9]
MTVQPLVAPLAPSVLDAIRDTPVAPLLNRPTEEILAQIGIPQLPQLPGLPPLPGLPALPPIDPMALMKPVTDLFSGFGNGNLSANGGLDPQAVFQSVTESISTALQLATTGLQLLQSMQSAGSQAATSAAMDTATTSTAIAGQATTMNGVTAGAAGTVATGYLQMAAVAARFAMTTAALGPTLVTPPGQAALLATAIEAGAEATTITAQTKAQLAVQSGQMTEAGTPVPVRKPVTPKLSGLSTVSQPLSTSATSGASMVAQTPGVAPTAGVSSKSVSTAATSSAGSGQQILQQVVQLVQPLITAANQVGKQVVAALPTTSAPEAAAPVVNRPAQAPVPATPIAPVTAGAPVSSAAAPLGGWQAETVAVSPGASAPVAAASSARYAAEVTPPLLPGAGAPITAPSRSRAADGVALVDASHIDDLVDSGAETSAPVIGDTQPGRSGNPYSL